MTNEYLAVFSIVGPNHPRQLALLSRRVSETGGNIVESIKYVLGDRSTIAAFVAFEMDPKIDEQKAHEKAQAALESAALLKVSLLVTEEFRSCDIAIHRTSSQYEFWRDHLLTAEIMIIGVDNRPGELDRIVSVINDEALVIVRHRAFQDEKPEGSPASAPSPFQAFIRVIKSDHLALDDAQRLAVQLGDDGVGHDGFGYDLAREPELKRVVDKLNTMYRVEGSPRYGARIIDRRKTRPCD